MLQFYLGLLIGTAMGVFIMCLLIMAGRSPEPPEEPEVDQAKVPRPIGEPHIKFQD